MSREHLLLVSSGQTLRQRYGRTGLDRILVSLEIYRDSLLKRRVELTVAFVDDKTSLARFGIRPAKTITSLSVKNAVDRIVAQLSGARGPDVSVLILGGGETVPYFRLPNPAFDSDGSVFSDNPYGCVPGAVSSEKCLLPQRAVGRMPDGNGSDVRLLLAQLYTATEAATRFSKSRLSPAKSSFGYTASVWKKASQQVWRDIGFTGNLKTCPPLSRVDVTEAWFRKKNFLYFNLHGSDTEPHWFGQDGASFPKALSPADVNRLSREKSAVMTEACYGAIEMGRKPESSISLAFLSRGCVCVLGSTCIAYGALAPPVSEADLIAQNFFRNVCDEMTVGKALVKARAQLAAAMVSRQGYLDEDDRKTLLQFVLFGDPTVSALSIFRGSGENAKNNRLYKGLKKGSNRQGTGKA